jgi:AraC family transcriptional regulator
MTAPPAQQRVSIGAVPQHLPDAPIATTRDRGWSGITLDLHAFAPQYVVAAPARDHHLICYCPYGRGRLIQRRAGKNHDSVISSGMSILMPAGYDSVWEGDAATSARLRVPTELIVRASEEIGARAQANFEILNVFRMHDPIIESLSKLLLGELDRPSHPAQRLIVEATSHALAAHLLRSHNAFEAPSAEQISVLGAGTLANITSYIEEHLGGSIGLAELAAIARVSRFHFTRLFKRSTGLTPMAYVERSRIRQAQVLLKMAELPLSEIALVVGFADQSHFTRRFHRHVGFTPAAFARDHGIRRFPRRFREY